MVVFQSGKTYTYTRVLRLAPRLASQGFLAWPRRCLRTPLLSSLRLRRRVGSTNDCLLSSDSLVTYAYGGLLVKPWTHDTGPRISDAKGHGCFRTGVIEYHALTAQWLRPSCHYRPAAGQYRFISRLSVHTFVVGLSPKPYHHEAGLY